MFLLFSVVTLPVEFNASKQALAVVEERGYLNRDEMVGARLELVICPRRKPWAIANS